jgi:very-short-patch-repair endonuclease
MNRYAYLSPSGEPAPSRRPAEGAGSPLDASGLWTTGSPPFPGRQAARVPVPPRRPPELQGQVFRGSRAVAGGVLTRKELRGPAWRRLFRDVHADAALEVTHELRAIAAASVLVPGAVVSGRSAAVLWGLDVAGPLPEECTRRRGVAVTTPEVTAVALARSAPLDEAVVLVDQFVASGMVDLEPVRAVAAASTGRGCRQARTAVALADGLAASPQETRLRLLLHRSTLPRPIAQFSVRNGAVFVARVDFAWPERRIAVEYDGLWHAEDGQFAHDRRRLNRLLAAGWRVVFVTAADLRRPDELLARVAQQLAR